MDIIPKYMDEYAELETYSCNHCFWPTLKYINVLGEAFPPTGDCPHCDKGTLDYYGAGDQRDRYLKEQQEEKTATLKKRKHVTFDLGDSDSENDDKDIVVLSIPAPPPQKKARVAVYIDLTENSDAEDDTPVIIVNRQTLTPKSK